MTSDAAVIGRVRAGDADAFGLLVERYHDRCARLAMRLLGDPDDAADAVQDAFIRAYDSLAAYQERDRFGSWLLCIVANRCRSAADATRRRASIAAEWSRMHNDAVPATCDRPPSPHTDGPPAPDDAHILSAEIYSAAAVSERDHALAERLSAALSELPAVTRSAVVRKYAEEWSYEELSAETGMGVSALKMRVARGSAQLRRALAGTGVTVAIIALIFATHHPATTEHKPATMTACDTLRSIMRDTLSQSVRDSMLSSGRCASDPLTVEPRRTRATAALDRIEKRGL